MHARTCLPWLIASIARGKWQGVLQGYDGAVPEPLLQLARKWSRLTVPQPLPAG